MLDTHSHMYKYRYVGENLKWTRNRQAAHIS